MKRPAVFAIPGDIDTRTGGYIYEKQLLLALRRAGREVQHLALPGSYPAPTSDDLFATETALAAIPADVPVLLDGFLSGATDPDRLARMQAPYVPVTHHPLALENGLPPERAAHLRAVETQNLARAAHVIVPSPHTADILTQSYAVPPARITIAPPGLVLAPPAQPARRDGAPLILSVGQLVIRKGHDILLQALADLADLDWHAVIVGKSPDSDHARDLEYLRDRLGLRVRVRFAGEVDADELAALYAEARIFALATRYEGYGMVFAEALAYGLPIVASTGGAVTDTVPRDAGLLVPPDDATAFGAALRVLLKDPDRRAALATAAAAHGAALPSWDDTARLVSDVLDRV